MTTETLNLRSKGIFVAIAPKKLEYETHPRCVKARMMFPEFLPRLRAMKGGKYSDGVRGSVAGRLRVSSASTRRELPCLGPPIDIYVSPEMIPPALAAHGEGHDRKDIGSTARMNGRWKRYFCRDEVTKIKL